MMARYPWRGNAIVLFLVSTGPPAIFAFFGEKSARDIGVVVQHPLERQFSDGEVDKLEFGFL